MKELETIKFLIQEMETELKYKQEYDQEYEKAKDKAKKQKKKTINGILHMSICRKILIKIQDQKHILLED